MINILNIMLFRYCYLSTCRLKSTNSFAMTISTINNHDLWLVNWIIKYLDSHITPHPTQFDYSCLAVLAIRPQRGNITGGVILEMICFTASVISGENELNSVDGISRSSVDVDGTHKSLP